MNILHISAECYPVAKVGGLADVVGALPKYQQELHINSNVIMPFYDIAFTKNNNYIEVYKSSLFLGEESFDFRILKLQDQDLGFDLFCVDVPKLLFKDYVYSADDTERFLAFQIATLNWILTLEDKPDLIHTHDHHTGLIPFMISECFKYESLKHTPTVLTIHNAQYQGWFPHHKVHLIPAFNFDKVGLLDWNSNVNPLAAAIKCAWKVTTVSPSYMEELKQNANGLESLLRHESAKCVGILNGIDWNVWNPETDSYIKKAYNQSTVKLGKETNKNWLCKEFDLDEKKPLFVFIGRLVGEKGADLFPEIFEKALQENDISILLLGSGHKETEQKLSTLDNLKNYNSYIGYDEKLSHIIYAGADFLLMPSRVEPCGLNQMYALRYGTVPIVNKIGGLKDTVTDINENGFGICHNGVTIEKVTNAISRAALFYNNQKDFLKNSKKIMLIDHSWSNSAQEYVNLYKSLKK
ncbi:glycogen synthase [Polaribacter sp. MSW13]|uniref:Glycogen synthase n=1 Tax=Polaribacter marinus TaxID=2916838 RepID=A0A9X2AJJ6_9FLAO|nr:glycogen synthase [Polaribacter marinus]